MYLRLNVRFSPECSGVLITFMGSVFGFPRKSCEWVSVQSTSQLTCVLYFLNREKYIMMAISPGIARIGEVRGSAALGLFPPQDGLVFAAPRYFLSFLT